MEAQLINKEDISTISFMPSHVNDTQKRLDVIKKLKRAETLGNAFKSKCKIYFRDTLGLKIVETTIWMVSDKYVNLKGGRVIPIDSIEDVLL
jgi:hypothetical protein